MWPLQPLQPPPSFPPSPVSARRFPSSPPPLPRSCDYSTPCSTAGTVAAPHSYALATLNEDCCVSILMFLTVDEISTVAKTCAFWSSVARGDFLWELLLLRDAPPRALRVLWEAVLHPTTTTDEAARRVALLMQALPAAAARIGLGGLSGREGPEAMAASQPARTHSRTSSGTEEACRSAAGRGAYSSRSIQREFRAVACKHLEAEAMSDPPTPSFRSPLSALAAPAHSPCEWEISEDDTAGGGMGLCGAVTSAANLQELEMRLWAELRQVADEPEAALCDDPRGPQRGCVRAGAASDHQLAPTPPRRGSRSMTPCSPHSRTRSHVAAALSAVADERRIRGAWARVSWRVAYYALAIDLSVGGGPVGTLLLSAAPSCEASATEIFHHVAQVSPAVAQGLPPHIQAQIWRNVKALLGAAKIGAPASGETGGSGRCASSAAIRDTRPSALEPNDGAFSFPSDEAAPAAPLKLPVEILGACPAIVARKAAAAPTSAATALQLPTEDALRLCGFAIRQVEAAKEVGLWYMRTKVHGTLAMLSSATLLPFCCSFAFYRAFSHGATHAERILNFSWFGLRQPPAQRLDPLRVRAVMRTAHISFLWQGSGNDSERVGAATHLASSFSVLTAPAMPVLFLCRILQARCRIGAAPADQTGALQGLGYNLFESALGDAAGLWIELLVSPFLAKRLEHAFVVTCTTVLPTLVAVASLRRIAVALRRRVALWSPVLRQNIFCLVFDTAVPAVGLSLAVLVFKNGWTPLSLMRVLGRFTIQVLGVSLSQNGLIDQDGRGDETALMAHVCGALTVSLVRTVVRVAPHWKSPLSALRSAGCEVELREQLARCKSWQQRCALLDALEEESVERTKRFATLVLFEELTVWAGACAIFIKEGSLAAAIGWKVGMSCALNSVSYAASAAFS